MFFKKFVYLMVFSLWNVAIANEATSTQGTAESTKTHPQVNESTKAQPSSSATANGNANAPSNQPPSPQRIPLNIYCKHHTC